MEASVMPEALDAAITAMIVELIDSEIGSGIAEDHVSAAVGRDLSEAEIEHIWDRMKAARTQVKNSGPSAAGELRALRWAIARAARALREGDNAALATVNETLQPLVDAAMARIAGRK